MVLETKVHPANELPHAQKTPYCQQVWNSAEKLQFLGSSLLWKQGDLH